MTFPDTYNLCAVNRTFVTKNIQPGEEMSTSVGEGSAHEWNNCLGSMMINEKIKEFQEELKQKDPALYAAMKKLSTTFDNDDLLLAGELHNINTLCLCLTKQLNKLQGQQYVKLCSKIIMHTMKEEQWTSTFTQDIVEYRLFYPC